MNNRLLEELYQKYSKEIILYLFSLCGNWEMAEDLKQETFVKALLSMPKNYNNIRAWLYKVGRNLCLNQMKKEHRIVLVDKEEFLNSISHVFEGDLLENYILKEQARILYRALLKLPTPKKEILELQYFSNMSLKEIADIMHLSYENVRVLKMRAKNELKKILEEDGYEVS